MLSPVCSAAPQHLCCDLNEENAIQLCDSQQRAAGWRSTLTGNPLEGELWGATPKDKPPQLMSVLLCHDGMQRDACMGKGKNQEMSAKQCKIEEILKDRRDHKGCQTLRTNIVCECVFIFVLKSQIDTVCLNQIIVSGLLLFIITCFISSCRLLQNPQMTPEQYINRHCSV